jgi:hypothetical protein
MAIGEPSSAFLSAMMVKIYSRCVCECVCIKKKKKRGPLPSDREETVVRVCEGENARPSCSIREQGARPIVCDVLLLHQKRVRERERERKRGGPWLFSGWAECGVVCEVGRASVCTPPKHDKSLTEPKMSATLSFLTSLIAFFDREKERKYIYT